MCERFIYFDIKTNTKVELNKCFFLDRESRKLILLVEITLKFNDLIYNNNNTSI